jgi:hypothetical protein
VSSYQEGVLIYEYSCGFADHVNVYDEKSNTSTIKEEDQRCILMIGGSKNSCQVAKQSLVQVLHMRRWCNKNPRKRPWGQMILKLTMSVM